jgi:hypothetical protein
MGRQVQEQQEIRAVQLAEDAVDLYHKPLRAALLPLLLLYTASYVLGGGAALTENSPPPAANESQLVGCSSDVGLCMTFRADRPLGRWLLRGHAIAAVALCCLVVAQKELVRRIATTRSTAGAASPKPWRTHRQLGYTTLATMLTMNLCGYLMGPSSDFEGFQQGF